jgi:hypothetical protein
MYEKGGYQFDIMTTYYAAEKGHLECLKYLHEKVGCPWSSETTKAAAENGHLECLKYAHKNGCPWSSETIWGAFQLGYLSCLKYAFEAGFLFDLNKSAFIVMDPDRLGPEYISLNPLIPKIAITQKQLKCLLYCLDNPKVNISFNEVLDVLHVSEDYLDFNLVNNIDLRNILLHPKLKDKIEKENYPFLTKAIKEYKKYLFEFQDVLINKIYVTKDIVNHILMLYI